MTTRFIVYAAFAAGLAACARDTTLPPVPQPPRAPAISSFTPHAAFSGDRLVLFGEHLDVSGNQLLFPGGVSALAEAGDEGDLRVDGGVVFVVPEGLDLTGPLVVTTTEGRSLPSADDFAPLGVGHPNYGTPVSTLRFRHAPVGLVDQAENVLMASSIFDLVVTDGKSFHRVPGRPVALTPSPTAGRALLSVRTPSGGGALLELSGADGEVLLQSAERDTLERFLLPATAPQTLARSVGQDLRGRTWLSEWRAQNGALEAARRELPLIEVLGAAALGDALYVAGRSASPLDSQQPAIFAVTSSGVTRAWTPRSGNGCNSTSADCAAPDGPMAVVPSASGGAPTVAVSLATGDLLLLDAGSHAARIVRLLSYASVDALAAGLAPGKLLLTKSQDGALFQYDLATEALDWSVPLRGEPSVLHLAAGLDEIAVGNRADNAVDIVTASSGTWVGRIAFDLGLGSAGGREGGIVAPYSYDPQRYPPGATVKERLDLLLRNVGLVASIDASSLEVFEHLVLDGTAGEPLRLFVTDALETLVVHQRRLGLLEDADAQAPRRERLVTRTDFATAPLDLTQLPSGEIAVSTQGAVQLFRWSGAAANRELVFARELVLPANATWLATVPSGDELLVVWRTTAGFSGGFFDPATLSASATPAVPLVLGPGVTDFVGAVALPSGPLLLFGNRGTQGPVAYSAAALREGLEPVASVIGRRRVSGVSPDGRYVVWLDEGAEEPMARLVTAFDGEPLEGYSTYRLSGAAAGPTFDPSGQWIYLPVPRVDELAVFK